MSAAAKSGAKAASIHDELNSIETHLWREKWKFKRFPVSRAIPLNVARYSESSAAADIINTAVYSLRFAIDEVTLPVTAPSAAPSSSPPLGPQPGGAQLAALTFRPGGFKQLSPTYVIDLKAELAGGRCVAFSIPVFNSWYRSQWVANTGDITMPVPNEIRAGGHAMCLVGYVDMPNNQELGFGRFILRNSWGANWGINSPYGAGYGTIPYAYLAKLGTEAYSIL